MFISLTVISALGLGGTNRKLLHSDVDSSNMQRMQIRDERKLVKRIKSSLNVKKCVFWLVLWMGTVCAGVCAYVLG